MARESDTSNVQIDDSENNQLENAPGVVTGGRVRSPIPLPLCALRDLSLDLIAYSGYRRPPPARQ